MTIEKLAEHVESAVKALLNADSIEIDQVDFYHVLSTDIAIWMTEIDGAAFVGTIDLKKGEGTYAEAGAEELDEIKGAIESESPGGILRWIGVGEDGPFALYQDAEGILKNIKLSE